MEAAAKVVDALKTSPLLLVLLLFNGAFFVMLHHATSENRSRQAELVNHLLDNQAKMQEMLLRCLPANR